MGVINKLFGRLRLTSDPTVSTQTSTVIQTDTTNSSIAIVPNGTGAIIASIPDGTATGGNARGANAVDLQTNRSAAAMVAGGSYSVISGGRNNRVSNDGTCQDATISGGNNNYVNYASGNTIGGGRNNTAGGGSGFIDATIVGGNSNTATGNNVTIGGSGNTVSNTSASAFGGLLNVSGQYAGALGYNSNVSGTSSFSFGESNQVPGSSSVAVSSQGKAYLNRQFVIGGTWNAPPYEGSNQVSTVVVTRSGVALTSGATTTLSTDGNGTSGLLVPDGNRAWAVRINYVAVVTAITGTATGVNVGDIKTQSIEVGFKRIVNTVTLVGSGTYSVAQEDASMSSASLVPSAGGSINLALTFTAPTFAGGGSVTCRLTARVELTELNW